MTRRPEKKRHLHRRWILSIAGMAIMAIITPMAIRGPTLILWNASASVPVGLYFVQPNASLHVGDLAVGKLPPDTLRLAAERQYLPRDVLLIKPVAAVGGAAICRQGNEIYVDGVHAGNAQTTDRHHRPMPNWQGCRELASAEIFLMNPAVADSFDGRYFGPIPRRLVQGRAFPLLTFAQPPRT